MTAVKINDELNEHKSVFKLKMDDEKNIQNIMRTK